MPINNDNVAYKYGTQSQFDTLGTKDGSTFYVTTDSQRMYLGDTEIGHGDWEVTVTVTNSNYDLIADKTSSEIMTALRSGKRVVAVFVIGNNKYRISCVGYNQTDIVFSGEASDPLMGSALAGLAFIILACDIEDSTWSLHFTPVTSLLFLDEQFLSSLSYCSVDLVLTTQQDQWTATFSCPNKKSLPNDQMYQTSRLPWVISVDGAPAGLGLWTSLGIVEGYNQYLIMLSSPYQYRDREILGIRVTSYNEIGPHMDIDPSYLFLQEVIYKEDDSSLLVTVTTNADNEVTAADKSYTEVTAAVDRNIDIRVKVIVPDEGVTMMQYMGTVNGCHNFLGFKPSSSDYDSRLVDTRLKCYQESGNDAWRIINQGK